MTKNNGFPTPVAARFGGVTPRILDNWNRRDVLSPSLPGGEGRTHSRMYSFRDVVAIRVLATLRDAGIDLRGLRRVVDYVRARKGLSATESLASACLITDGHDVFEIDGSSAISALMRPGQGVLHVVQLTPIVVEIQRAARALLRAA